MDVVYLVAAHRNPEMLGELLDALSPARVIVHIDAKTEIRPFLEAARGYPSVRFTDRRIDVKWGGWSQVSATLLLMADALRDAEDDDYLVLLSGDSYPLRPTSVIRQTLRESRGRLYLEAVPVRDGRGLPPREFGTFSRLSRFTLEYDRETGPNPLTYVVNRIPVHRPFRRGLGGRTAYNGSQWWTMTAEAARWVLAEGKRDPRFVRLCRTSAVPDEFFFPTLLMNSPFRDAVRPSLMYVDWSTGSGGSPGLILSGSLPELRRRVAGAADEDDVLFARKVADPRVARSIREQVWPAAPVSPGA